MRISFLRPALAVLGLLAPAAAQYVYVSNSGSDSIAGYRVSNDGTLVSTSSFNIGPPGQREIAVDGNLKFLYASTGSGLLAFRIDSGDGSLTPVSGSPFGSGYADTLAVDPSGRFLYAASNGGNALPAYRIGDDGTLTPISGSMNATSFPINLAVSSSGQFVYAINCCSLDGYSIDPSTGALSPIPGVSVDLSGKGLQGISTDPSGKYLYVTGTSPSAVYGFQVDNAGHLTPVPGPPPAAGAYPLDIVISAGSPEVVYVANRYSENISAFLVNSATGQLTAVPGSPFAAGSDLRSVGLSRSGQYLYAANYGDGNGTSYAIVPSTGALVLPATFVTGTQPISVSNPPVSNVRLTTSALPSAASGQPYSFQIQAAGGFPPYIFSWAGNPPGLTLDPLSGVISGVATVEPEMDFAYVATLTVRDSGGTLSNKQLPLLVVLPSLQITTDSLPDGQFSEAYATVQMTAVGGTPPYSWSASGLPPGLQIQPSGTISGKPISAGSFNPVISVNDTANHQASMHYSLTIYPPLQLLGSAPTSAKVGQAYSATFKASGGVMPYSFSLDGEVPSGLSFSSSGAAAMLGGTPAAAVGPNPIQVTVTDQSAAMATYNFTLTVASGVTLGPLTATPGALRFQGCAGQPGKEVFPVALSADPAAAGRHVFRDDYAGLNSGHTPERNLARGAPGQGRSPGWVHL